MLDMNLEKLSRKLYGTKSTREIKEILDKHLREITEQAHMAGQGNAGVDPSYSEARKYYDDNVGFDSQYNSIKPSAFKNTKPISSTYGKSEAETVALNIMVILARNGDIWRELPINEYIDERKKDGNYSSMELVYFESIVWHTVNIDRASAFSGMWKQIAEPEEIEA